MYKLALVLATLVSVSSAFAAGPVYTKQYAQKMKFLTMSGLTDDVAGQKVLYFGGPVINNVKVIMVVWGPSVSTDVVNGMNPFYQDLTNSTYMDMLAEYSTKSQNIGHGSLAGMVQITPFNTGKKLDKKDVEKELVAQIDAGKLTPPDANTLYMIHFPKGMRLGTGGIYSCEQWCGDHEGFKSDKYGNVYYAMLPDISECLSGCSWHGSNALEATTDVASHELSEAVTDPMCPDIGQEPAFPAAWLAADQNEIGDLCTSSGGNLNVNGHTYVVQGEWSNNANGCILPK